MILLSGRGKYVKNGIGEMNYLLDTNVVIYLHRGLLADVLPKGNHAISIITEIELRSFSGLSEGQEEWLNRFIDVVNVIDLDSQVKEAAIQLRKKTKLKLPDAVIAASAVVHDRVLLTNDDQLQKLEGIKTLGVTINS